PEYPHIGPYSLGYTLISHQPGSLSQGSGRLYEYAGHHNQQKEYTVLHEHYPESGLILGLASQQGKGTDNQYQGTQNHQSQAGILHFGRYLKTFVHLYSYYIKVLSL